MYQVHVEQEFRQPVEEVWSVYADHADWKNWTAMTTSYLHEKGADEPNGVGAVRVLGAGGVNSYEQVTLFEPGKRMEYKVVKGGLPFIGHYANVNFHRQPDGSSRVVWECTFDAGLWGLGPIMKGITTIVYRTTLGGLKKYLDKR